MTPMALRVDPRLGAFAKRMRSAPTPAEGLLRQRLRAARLNGIGFRRQTVIEGRIVDFFCPAVGLAIEVDGDTHDRIVDRQRDALLARSGMTVLRFTNEEVLTNVEGVLTTIAAAAADLPARFTHPPAPSLEREGGT